MSTLWITGAGGVVGHKLVQQAVASRRYARIGAFTHTAASARTQDWPATVTWSALDIANREAVRAAATALPPDVIINPAAMTNVDACERQSSAAQRANADGPRHLAEIARARGAHVLHVSTDYVFPGDAQQPGPYAEDAAPRAINIYGQTKLDGERAVAEVCAGDTPYTVVRTALVYGLIPGGRGNFVTWLAGELATGRRVRIVRDQFNTPTLADDLASVLLWLAAEGVTGTYHAAGPDFIGRDAWALAIAARFGLDTRFIEWVTTAELAQLAPRPLRSGLLCPRLATDRARGAPGMRGVAAGLRDIPWLAPGS